MAQGPQPVGAGAPTRTAAHLRGLGTTVFAAMTRLANEHRAVNLGQGFPDFDGPQAMLEAAARAMRDGKNQYARSFGVPALNDAIARHQQRFYGLAWDPDGEVTVTSGATEAICATLLGICEPGDEVIVLEPFYDSYLAGIAMAHARPRAVTLRAPSFALDVDAVRAACTARTRAILLNTPHNPTGKVFSRADLEALAALARERDLIVISDEVYEHLVYEGEHIPIASLDGMRERTVQISSAGKTFSCTGWKVGWTCAPPALTAAVRTAHQFITFSTATPFQHAIAEALDLPDGYYETLCEDYRARRARLAAGLTAAGLTVLEPEGSYFIVCDIAALTARLGRPDLDDVRFCEEMCARAGLAAIPTSAFYVNKHEGSRLVRFAFCKTPEVLDAAIARLADLPRAFATGA